MMWSVDGHLHNLIVSPLRWDRLTPMWPRKRSATEVVSLSMPRSHGRTMSAIELRFTVLFAAIVESAPPPCLASHSGRLGNLLNHCGSGSSIDNEFHLIFQAIA
jgi:hypothetical protein